MEEKEDRWVDPLTRATNHLASPLSCEEGKEGKQAERKEIPITIIYIQNQQ
jgi:hypothetical protein